jgi:hypothetical protein
MSFILSNRAVEDQSLHIWGNSYSSCQSLTVGVEAVYSHGPISQTGLERCFLCLVIRPYQSLALGLARHPMVMIKHHKHG